MNQQLKINTINNKSMYKSIINILDKPKLSTNDISLAWIKAKDIDKTLVWSNFRSLQGRNQYLIDIMQKERLRLQKQIDMYDMQKKQNQMHQQLLTVKSNRLEIDKIDRKRKRAIRPEYTINFRVLTNRREKLKDSLFVGRDKNKKVYQNHSNK